MRCNVRRERGFRCSICAAAVATLALASPTIAEDCGFKTPPDISISRELMITDLSVVNDARAETADGAWSFAHLLSAVAGDRQTARHLIKDWLLSWETPHTINGFALAPRPAVAAAIVKPWMTRDHAMSLDAWVPDLAHAPFRLLAIVYRPDLGIIAQDGTITSAGEARFVFTALDISGNSPATMARPLPLTVIFEYTLPATDRDTLRQWAERWHKLGHMSFGADYNAALQVITDGFDHAADGNPPPRLRTNDGLATPWQFREFHFDATSKRFANAPVTNTPDLGLIENNTELSAQINAHPGDDIPSRFIGGSAEIPDRTFRWPSMATDNNVLRHNFAMLTCNGCHSAETGRKADVENGVPGGFRHLGGRLHDEQATLSEFLTGNPAVVPDPSGKLLLFCDLKLRQKALFEALHAVDAPDSSPDLAVARERRQRTD
jgi:hypothetical protein